MNNFSDTELILLGLVVAWELVWKGFALWRAARNSDQGWYVALLILNTVGVLPIIYLLTHQDRKTLAKEGENEHTDRL